MNFILVGPNGRPSIRELLSTFKFSIAVSILTPYTTPKGVQWYRIDSSNPRKKIRLPRLPSFTSSDIVIRWGTRVEISTGSAVVYNSNRALNNASNKKTARELLERGKIAVPKTYKIGELYKAPMPVVIRPERHRAGINFHVCYTDNEAERAIRRIGGTYYISDVYPKTEEYRVHVALGKALLIKRKPEPKDKSVVAWNFHQNELPWSTIDRKDYDLEMVKLACDAVKELGLDFGAVDIMSKPTNKKLPNHVVVEVNTAPSYTPYLIEKYGALFNLLFRQKKKMDTWDYSKFKSGKSFSWKNFQLRGETKRK